MTECGGNVGSCLGVDDAGDQWRQVLQVVIVFEIVPSAVKLPLDVSKNQLDRVEFRTVRRREKKVITLAPTNVVDSCRVVNPGIVEDDRRPRWRRQTIDERRDRLVVDALRKDDVILKATAGDGHQQGIMTPVFLAGRVLDDRRSALGRIGVNRSGSRVESALVKGDKFSLGQ